MLFILVKLVSELTEIFVLFSFSFKISLGFGIFHLRGCIIFFSHFHFKLLSLSWKSSLSLHSLNISKSERVWVCMWVSIRTYVYVCDCVCVCAHAPPLAWAVLTIKSFSLLTELFPPRKCLHTLERNNGALPACRMPLIVLPMTYGNLCQIVFPCFVFFLNKAIYLKKKKSLFVKSHPWADTQLPKYL